MAAPGAAARPRGPPLRLFVAGGRCSEGQALGSGERFTPQIGHPRLNKVTGVVSDGEFAKCVPLSPMRERRWSAAGACMEDTLYMLGGYDGEMILRTAECYHVATNSWELLPAMDFRRSQAAAAAVHGKVYVCGGYNGSTELADVRCFNSITREWSALPPMTERRLDCSMAAIESSVYVAGGAREGESLDTAERLNLEPDLAEGEEFGWERLQPMSTPRRLPAMCNIRTMVWVCGGHTGTRSLNTVEMWDLRAKEWSGRNPMKESRFGAACGFMSEVLYVAGGHSSTTMLSSIEAYSFNTQTWEVVITLGVPRAMCAGGMLRSSLLEDPLEVKAQEEPPAKDDQQ